MKLSTRPEKYLGELSVWDEAESKLKKALDEFGAPWTVDPGENFCRLCYPFNFESNIFTIAFLNLIIIPNFNKK